MSVVHLRPTVRAGLIAHARDEAPDECCGLLIGTGTVIEESVRVPNVDARPRSRYLLDPAAHIAVRRLLRGTPRVILGVYHSHPESPAVPSDTDLLEACYPEFVWIIVSLVEPGRPAMAAFRLCDRVATPLTLLEAP